MSRVYVCFGLDSTLTNSMSVSENLERDYIDIYKNAATFFYSHPGCPFFFSFTGKQISYYHKKHPELLKIFHELENRKQIEIIGGGYWNPIFPLLFPADRSSQIEMLSTAIRTTIGKRPRGMRLCAENWDSAMVSSLQTCGIEYVLLENEVIPQTKQCYLPLVMSERGKSVDIVPVYKNFKSIILNPDAPTVSKEDKKNIAWQFLKDIQKKAVKTSAPESVQGECRMVTISLSLKEFKSILENGILESIYETACEFEDIKISLPTPCRKIMPKLACYLPACLSEKLALWASVPYVPTPVKSYQITIFDFLQLYPQVKALYDRMLYVSLLANQCRGDKMRKNTAREKLWEAQAGEAYICSPEGVFAPSAKRHHIYNLLIEAEQFIRSASEFKESVTEFDYNGDGINEYVIRMQDYTACVYPSGGAIRELDIMQDLKNYAANLNRIEMFDGISDNYWRGLFVDHLFSANDFEKYKKNESAGDGIFSRLKYDEIRFSSPRNEIQLAASASFGEKSQKVVLKKKYLTSSNGMVIQYILKNDSTEKLSANLVIESNFAETNFENDSLSSYKVQIVTDGAKKEFTENDISGTNSHQAVSAIQVVDENISFVFEPNENCESFFAPLTFSRPTQIENNEIKTTVDGKTLCVALLWPIELEPGHETEKTINFGILHSRKERRKKTK